MPSTLGGAARLHRRQFEALVGGAGKAVTVRQPAVRTMATTAMDKVLGKQIEETGVGTTVVVQALWSTDINASAPDPRYRIPDTIAALGRGERIDALARCKLADALPDPTNVYGRTIFDTAKDVSFGDYLWTVVGTARSGLSPEDPYVLWVALKKVGES